MNAASAHRLILHGRQVRYRRAGRGPQVVLVHGLGLSSRFWTPHFPVFAAAGLCVIAPDLPGFGGSDGPRTGLSVDETARWLLDFADALGIRRAAWLGHSLAAQPVLELAARAPERASALVLASPTGAPHRFPRLHQALGLLRDISREPFALVPAVLSDYVRTTPWAYLGTWLKAAAADQPLRTAAAVRCPALIVAGVRDPIVPDAYVDALRRTLPSPEIRHIGHGAHGVAYGDIEGFNRIVTGYLRRVL